MRILSGRLFVVFVFCIFFILINEDVHSGTEKNSGEEKYAAMTEELKDGFTYILKGLAYGNYYDIPYSTQNPDNNFLQIPKYSSDLELRPDFFLHFRALRLQLKPRLDCRWQQWEEGRRKGDDETDANFFVNEWIASLRFFDGVHVSYGRENLQWGPSYFISPSNPFFRDNGQSNPKKEVPGMDFARLVWVMNPSWSVSMIVNTDEGRQLYPEGFERTYACKMDYTGYGKYMSWIVSYQDHDRPRLGAYAGWTVKDSLLIYGEASFFRGSRAFYPLRDMDNPLGYTMKAENDDKNSLQGIVLLGGTYTFESGYDLTLEYILNSPGYGEGDAQRYYELRRNASDNFYSLNPIGDLSRWTLYRTLDPGLRLLRRNYLMLQAKKANINDVLNVILRYTFNVDDSSSQLIPIVEYDIGNHLQLFFVGSHSFGGSETEFRNLLDNTVMAGIEYTY